MPQGIILAIGCYVKSWASDEGPQSDVLTINDEGHWVLLSPNRSSNGDQRGGFQWFHYHTPLMYSSIYILIKHDGQRHHPPEVWKFLITNKTI